MILLFHVLSLSEWDDDDDIDSNAPAILEESNEISGWYELDDIEHINGAMQMVDFILIQFPQTNLMIGHMMMRKYPDGYCLKGREGAYVSTDDPEGEYEP